MTFRTTLLITIALCFSMGTLNVLAGGKGSSNMDCNAQAAGMNDAEREAFMDACMAKNTPTAPAKTSAPAPAQQGKNTACQTEAQSRGLKGNERKTFMAECSGDSGGH